ncbi:MAG: hypothetical protein ACLFQJ_05955 [Campylobacterales bacterium]
MTQKTEFINMLEFVTIECKFTPDPDYPELSEKMFKAMAETLVEAADEEENYSMMIHYDSELLSHPELYVIDIDKMFCRGEVDKSEILDVNGYPKINLYYDKYLIEPPSMTIVAKILYPTFYVNSTSGFEDDDSLDRPFSMKCSSDDTLNSIMKGYSCSDKSREITVKVTCDVKYEDLNRLGKEFDLSKYANKQKRLDD